MQCQIAIVDGGGHYNFAPTSALAMAEFVKLLISITLHIMDFEGSRKNPALDASVKEDPLPVKAKAAWVEFQAAVSYAVHMSFFVAHAASALVL